MTADNEIDIKEAFQRAQKGHNNKAKLVASLKGRYNKVSPVSEYVKLLCTLTWFYVLLLDILPHLLTHWINPYI